MEVRTTSSTGGQKGMKPERYDLVPVEPLRQVALVYGYGAEKYDDNNWRKGYEWSKSYAALQRHLNQFWGGEDLDEESGLPHAAHAVFHLLSLLEWASTQRDFDDRPKPPPSKFALSLKAMLDTAPGGPIAWKQQTLPEELLPKSRYPVLDEWGTRAK